MERVNQTDKKPFAATVGRVLFDRPNALRWAAAFVIAGSLLALGDVPAFSQQVVIVDVNAVAQGYRLTKLLGKPVVNDMNQTVGSLDDLIVSKDQQLYAVLQVGSFLGIGGHLVAVPYTSMMIAPDASKIILPGASKDQLTKLPEFVYRQQ
jgi:hypothetical protein